MRVDAEVADLLKAKELRGEQLEVLGGQEIAGAASCGIAGERFVSSSEYMRRVYSYSQLMSRRKLK
jgi:hypothetical protein